MNATKSQLMIFKVAGRKVLLNSTQEAAASNQATQPIFWELPSYNIQLSYANARQAMYDMPRNR